MENTAVMRHEEQGEETASIAALRQMGRRMPGGFFIYRADGSEELLYFNDVMLDMFGCATGEELRALTGGTFKGLVHPDDLEAVEASIAEQVARSDKKLDYVEYRIRRRDGSVRWVDDYGRLVRTRREGDVYYVFIRDITEQHNAREESRRRARVIEGLSVDFSSIFLLDLDTGGMRPYRQEDDGLRELMRACGGADECADWRRVLPAYARRYVLPEDRARYLEAASVETMRRRLSETGSYAWSYRRAGRGGLPSDRETSVVRIGEDARCRWAVLGDRDITRQTARVREELAARLHLEAALEREKRANEVKDAFLFRVSHDLRTPMHAIMGFTSLAKRWANEPARLLNCLDRAEEASRRMLALIDDLLEMSHISCGPVTLREETCALAEEIGGVLDRFRPRAEAKGLSLAADIELPTEPVCVDAPRFRRVLERLVGNAVKFTPEGGHVTVSARRNRVSSSGYARYTFSVADDGIGMTEDFIARAFGAFEQEARSTETGRLGTGLGLSIAKRLVDAMGGSIHVRSKKGEGSTFVVELPLKRAADAKPSVASADPPARKTGGARRLLLVEDIEVNRFLAEAMLTEAGFVVEAVPDGCDAVEAVASRPARYYDAVLMDIQMPVMNGYEAARRIRAMGRGDTDALPIIALSANARESDRRMSLESGMNFHVAKPFDVAHLIAVIEECVTAASRETAQRKRTV